MHLFILIISLTASAYFNEGQVLARHAEEYEKIIPLVLSGKLKPVSTRYYSNEVAESAIILPDRFKHLSETKDMWVYTWKKTTVICFTTNGFIGRYTGYCYASNDDALNKNYLGKFDEPHLRFGVIRKIKPHWYYCRY